MSDLDGQPTKAYLVVERLVGHQDHLVYAFTAKEARERYRAEGTPTDNKIAGVGVKSVRRLPSEDWIQDDV